MDRDLSLNEYLKRLKGVSRFSFNVEGGYTLEQEFSNLAQGKTSMAMLKRAWSLVNRLNLLPKKMVIVGQNGATLMENLKKYSGKCLKVLEERKLKPEFSGFRTYRDIDLD